MSGLDVALTELTTATVLLSASIDARYGVIPNRLTYPTLGLLLVSAAAGHGVFVASSDMLSAALPFGLLYLGTGKRGIGLGDVKLAACIGAGLGQPVALASITAAFVIGGFCACVLLARGRAVRTTRIPFGPFLALGTVVAISVPTVTP